MSESVWQRLRAQSRLFIALGILILVVVWIVSGMLARETEEAPRASDPQPMAVAVTALTAEPVERLLVLQGRVEPDLRVMVRAETAGQVAEWAVALGARVAVGDELANLRMDDREARRRQAIARLRGAEEVRFVSRVAEPGTQTFRVEIAVPNPDEALPSGISAGVEIPTAVVQAHKLSPAWMGLDDAGRVGVKTVDAADRVVFHAVEVIRAAVDGVWVTGLPETARVITIGHGFVTDGERVRPQATQADPGAMVPESVDEAAP
ncbi:hypothetical protein [Thioalkalivibrio sp. ALM2T]|uniref:hypothetical protein n=1 Tax=Thioalkalivibrio sp. ALM2T TaxID=1158184 RepID=UPI000380F110|nr:hypothetical protein [Thioalkalivibrio sp. ALM2T]